MLKKLSCTPTTGSFSSCAQIWQSSTSVTRLIASPALPSSVAPSPAAWPEPDPDILGASPSRLARR
jgi:hypothetical protein